MRISVSSLALVLLLGMCCVPAVGAQGLPAPAPAPAASLDAATDTVVSLRWNLLVPRLWAEAQAARQAAQRAAAAGDSSALRSLAPLPQLTRLYTLLSVAQYEAVESARRDTSLSEHAAVAAASAAVLTNLLPDAALRVMVAQELTRDLDAARSEAGGPAQAGRRVGEELAEDLLTWARGDRMDAPWAGSIPTGPGMWRSAPGATPAGAAWAQARPWLLTSADQFRPGPPPAYDSPAFQAALDEVRQVARRRTPEQTRIAQRWAKAVPPVVWNQVAASALVRQGAANAEATRVLAVMNVAANDAIIACWEAKYHYWLLRPSHADTTLVLADSVGLPNFPAYPSGHACGAGAVEAVLAHFLPQERDEVTRLAEEAALSRLYAGVHYRFDNEVGLELGRRVGRLAVELEQQGGLRAWRKASEQEGR